MDKVKYLSMREIESVTVMGREIPVTELGDGIVSLLAVFANNEDAEKFSPNTGVLTVQTKEAKK